MTGWCHLVCPPPVVLHHGPPPHELTEERGGAAGAELQDGPVRLEEGTDQQDPGLVYPD